MPKGSGIWSAPVSCSSPAASSRRCSPLAYLFYLNWYLTCITIVALAVFGGAMALAFKRLRPLFRERGKINAEVTGRLNETLGGIRIVKTYTAEKREELVFTKGVHRLFRNVAQSITGVSASPRSRRWWSALSASS